MSPKNLKFNNLNDSNFGSFESFGGWCDWGYRSQRTLFGPVMTLYLFVYVSFWWHYPGNIVCRFLFFSFSNLIKVSSIESDQERWDSVPPVSTPACYFWVTSILSRLVISTYDALTLMPFVRSTFVFHFIFVL